jgi:peptidase S41-like protein
MVQRFAAPSGLALWLAACAPAAPPTAPAPPPTGTSAPSSSAAVPLPASPAGQAPGSAAARAPGEVPDVQIDDAVRMRVIQALAAHLQAEYVFPDMAERLGREVTEHHAAGRYAAVTSALELARALTADLQATSRDKHLGVAFQPEPPGDRGAGGASRVPFEPPRNGMIHQLQVLDGNIGYLQSNGVPPLAFSEEAISAAFAFLAHTRALILDCRGNGGGDPQTVAFYLSYLTHGAPFVINTFQTRDGSVEEFATRDLGELSYGEDKPVFVLTSQHTFSGGEELAYDLQALQRAVLVGEVTGGGANPARGVPLGDSFLARIPFAHPVNPFTNSNWEGVGVQPDLVVPAERALEVALDAARARLEGSSAAPQPKRGALPARHRPATAGVAIAGVSAKAARGPNLVTNGDFSSGSPPWGVMALGARGLAPHAYRVNDGALCTIASGGDWLFVGWPDDTHHDAFEIRAGASYELSFRASASGRLPLRATVKVGHAKPPYAAAVEADVPLDVRPTPFHVTFQSPHADDQAGVGFQVRAAPSQATSEVCLDDVELRETSSR